MADLTTTYMGLKLKSPVIAGASGLTSNLDMIKKIEEAGAGAIVCKSLFEEEIQLESLELNKDLHEHDNIHPEGLTLFPDLKEKGPDYHLYWVKKTKENSKIPVIASLNAVNEEIWIEYAKKIEQTGVDGIELNLYSSPDIIQNNSSNIEEKQLDVIKKIRKAIDLPISVKLSSYYTNLSGFVEQIDNIGIDGFVLFNRFFQSNIDINSEKFTLPFSLSDKEDNLLPLRFTGLLAGKVKGSLCSSTGIMDSDDVIRMILAGADAVQVVSTLYKNGPDHMKTILTGMEKWMDDKKYSSLKDFRGKMSRERLNPKDTWAYTRAQYVQMLMQPSDDLMDKIL
jgi:dihydroorotate dehydrogenase (fumarate)